MVPSNTVAQAGHSNPSSLAMAAASSVDMVTAEEYMAWALTPSQPRRLECILLLICPCLCLLTF